MITLKLSNKEIKRIKDALGALSAFGLPEGLKSLKQKIDKIAGDET